VGGTRNVALWDFEDELRLFAVPEPDLPSNRLNEGRVAPDGSFWVGSMQMNFASDGTPTEITSKRGRYYRIGPDGDVTRLSDDLITLPIPWFGCPTGVLWDGPPLLRGIR